MKALRKNIITVYCIEKDNLESGLETSAALFKQCREARLWVYARRESFWNFGKLNWIFKLFPNTWTLY